MYEPFPEGMEKAMFGSFLTDVSCLTSCFFKLFIGCKLNFCRYGLLLGSRAQVLANEGCLLHTSKNESLILCQNLDGLYGFYSSMFFFKVGYSAGHVANPSYQAVCTGMTGHAEVVRVIFDPKSTSYAALLRTFWTSHNPTQGNRQGNDTGSQYR